MSAPQLTPERRPPTPAMVHEVLHGLPEREQDAIFLARRDGLSYREVARALGISEAAAKSSMRSGLQRMRVEMLRMAAP